MGLGRWVPHEEWMLPSGKHTKKPWKITMFHEKLTNFQWPWLQVRTLWVITRWYTLYNQKHIIIIWYPPYPYENSYVQASFQGQPLHQVRSLPTFHQGWCRPSYACQTARNCCQEEPGLSRGKVFRGKPQRAVWWMGPRGPVWRSVEKSFRGWIRMVSGRNM